jgi:hypothetical protein
LQRGRQNFLLVLVDALFVVSVYVVAFDDLGQGTAENFLHVVQ